MVLLLVLVALFLAGCQTHGDARPEVPPVAKRQPASVTAAAPAQSVLREPAPATPSPAPPEPPPASVELVRVPGDQPASIVRSLDGAPPRIVFVPGLCSNANAYLRSFPESARAHGGVVAVEGDQGCGVDGFHSFSWDATRLHARIEKALTAGGVSEIPREGLTLVGYSQGAALAEQLVQRWPHRYARLVLIGAPVDPSPDHFRNAAGVVTMSCSRDVPWRMKEAARRIGAVGVPAKYVEMPGCSHGNIAEGDRSFDEAFDFLGESARPPAPDATVTPLAGTAAPPT